MKTLEFWHSAANDSPYAGQLSADAWLLLIALMTLCGCRAAPLERSTFVHTEAQASLQSNMQWSDARAVLDRRCVVCHGCYDAPCQLLLGSAEGIARGASKTRVYEGSRLRAIEPTRLFIDAHDTRSWREKGFFPAAPTASSDPAASLMLRMLDLKRQERTRELTVPADELGLDRKQQCPRADEFESFASKHPSWGMPYALPGLSESEHATLAAWLLAGAPAADDRGVERAEAEAIARWEAFLNQPSNKGRLMARYIYEHLFLASLYFDRDARRFFRLIRARTPRGEEIATRRPFDDPGVERVYYRIVPRVGTVLAKTHMPYALSDERLERYRTLLLEPAYEVSRLPSYDPAQAANPFATYHALPVAARYRFMLEEARFTMNGFIKGPVCRGQVALDVIEDRFWVTFVHPDSPVTQHEADLLSRSSLDLRLPAEQGSQGKLLTWRRYARSQKRYLQDKADFLQRLAKTPEIVNLGQIWDGDGVNDNAALTVLRHYDNATVVKGLVGGSPKTTWVVSYAVLERIHYLLVAGFDVFGNVGHQLHTRRYMDYLRMEAEHNFLILLPRARRRALVDHWYRDTNAGLRDLVYGKVARFEQESGVVYHTSKPEQELNAMLAARLLPVRERKYELPEEMDVALRAELEALSGVAGLPASVMPETSFLALEDDTGTRHFTLLRESAHTNVAQLFREQKRRLPSEDSLTLATGFVGAYPQALLRVKRGQLREFVRAVQTLDGESSYAAMRARFGVRRDSADFWAHSDRIHDAYFAQEPLESGLFDYNRLQSR